MLPLEPPTPLLTPPIITEFKSTPQIALLDLTQKIDPFPELSYFDHENEK